MHNALEYDPKGGKHNLQITNSCHFHHQPRWFHLAWVQFEFKPFECRVLLKSVYVLVRMFFCERVVLQQIQGQWFTCQLGFSPHARMYIFKFLHEKEQYVIQSVVLSSFLCGILCTPFIQTIRYILLCLCCLMFHFVIIVIIVGSWL